MKAGDEMNAVNKTLYIPLYSRSFVTKKGIILRDEKAVEICDTVSMDLPNNSKTKWLSYYLGMRSAVFDSWLINKMHSCDDAVVLHIGCGLDSRNLRVGTSHHPWYDVDFPDVICERMKYYSQTIDYSMIETDATDDNWLNLIPHDKTAIIVMEGISMYIDHDNFNQLLRRLCDHFAKLHILIDTYTEFGVKASKYKNPVNDIGVSTLYGIDDPKLLTQGTGLCFVKQHSMTPDYLVEQLEGIERFVFKNIYAGKMSKKLYRMYEYKK